MLPPEGSGAFHAAAISIGTPGEHGQRVHPALWQRVPVRLLDKKTPSLQIQKLRDIGLPSQCLKLQGALYVPAYEAVMPRLNDANHWVDTGDGGAWSGHGWRICARPGDAAAPRNCFVF